MPVVSVHSLMNPRLWGLLLLSLLLRGPFFFRDVINWDESTFILMGQAVLEGHLPYTTILDVKPPLVFWGYGFLMAIFGQSVVAIRLGGLLWVWLTGLLTAAIYPALGGSQRQSTIVGGLTIVLLTFLWPGQATMTEHLALVPLMMTVWLLLRRPKFEGIYGIAGGLMGTASFLRSNLIYLMIALGVYIFVSELGAWRRGLRFSGAYLLGFGSMVGLTWLPYVVQGKGQLWWKFVVLAPLHYSQARSTELWQILGTINIGLVILAAFLLITLNIAIAITLLRQWQVTRHRSHQRAISLLAVTFFAIELSIIRSGMGEDHYLLQLIPFVAIALVGLVSRLRHQLTWKPYLRTYLLIPVLIFCLNEPIRLLVKESALVGERLWTHESLLHGASYDIADYIRKTGHPKPRLYMMVDHLVYWLLDTPPLTPLVAHPSTIGKEYMVKIMLGEAHNRQTEFAKLLNQQPDFIVKTESLWYLPTESDLGQMLEKVLEAQYQLVTVIEGRQIYQHLG